MLWGIFVASFLESILVPIPLEAILIPLMQIHRDKIWKLATSALAGCLLGACVGYSVGYFIFDLVGDHLVSLFSSQEQYQSVKATMSEQGFWFVFSVGVVPIPFQIAMLAAGATQYSIFGFLLASALSRSIRYYGLAVLVYFLGPQAENFFKKYRYKAIIFLCLLIAAGYLLFKYL